MEFNKDGYTWVKSNKWACVNCKLITKEGEANALQELEEKIVELEAKANEAELESLGNITMKAVSGIILDERCEEEDALEILGQIFIKILLGLHIS
jgi:hypothetical protein